MIRLSDFDYDLPKDLIAQYPLKNRSSCRLLVLDRKKSRIEHLKFWQITDFFNKSDLLVLNDSKVLPCRLIGKRKTGGRVEIFLLAKKEGLRFDAMISPGRVKPAETIIFGQDKHCRVISRNEVEFFLKDVDEVYSLGRIPLPPYIKREPEKIDSLYYQTVYARNDGSVASPTAGLHFTKSLLSRLNKKGVNTAYVTLHVGLATFKPVKTEDITDHNMGGEYFHVSEATAELIEKTRQQGKRVCAVGTTSCRTLETFAKGLTEGKTDLFIYPGYKFKIVDSLLTNFHLPKTTLFMLVCAFAGKALAQKAYKEAIENKYRFYSYGDAMLIL